MPFNTITPRAQSDDGRSFVIGPVNVPEPEDGQFVSLMLWAPWEFEVTAVVLSVADDPGCLVRILNSMTPVQFSGQQSTNGFMLTDDAIPKRFLATSGGVVVLDGDLQLEIDNLGSAPQDLVVQVEARRTQKNV